MKRGFCEDIERLTVDNDDFRRVLYTGEHLQLVVMTLQAGEQVGEEVHPDRDQFFRVEEGQGVIDIDGRENPVQDDFAVIVPAALGTTSATPGIRRCASTPSTGRPSTRTGSSTARPRRPRRATTAKNGTARPANDCSAAVQARGRSGTADDWGRWMRRNIAAAVLAAGLAFASQSACAMNSPAPAAGQCRVTGEGKLPPEIGGADALCTLIRQAVSASAPRVAFTLDVQVLSDSMLSATVTTADGRKLPEMRHAVMDRTLTRSSVERFGRALGAQLAQG